MVYSLTDRSVTRPAATSDAQTPSEPAVGATPQMRSSRASQLDQSHLPQDLHRSNPSDDVAAQTVSLGLSAAMTAEAGSAAVHASSAASSGLERSLRQRRTAGGGVASGLHPAANSAVASIAASSSASVSTNPHSIVGIDAMPGSPDASSTAAAPAAALPHGTEHAVNPGLSAEWRSASVWAAAALLSAVGSGTTIYFLEKFCKGIEFERVLLPDLKKPFPAEDIQRYLTASELKPTDGYMVTDYIKYGSSDGIKREDALFNMGDHALFRLMNDPNMKPALAKVAKPIKILMSLSRSSQDVYDEDRAMKPGLPVVDAKPGSQKLSLSVQQADYLSIDARKYEAGSLIPSDAAIPYTRTPRSDLYSRFLKPDAVFEFSACVGIVQAMQTNHFLSGYNDSNGQIPLKDLQREMISELVAQTLLANPLAHAQPERMYRYLRWQSGSSMTYSSGSFYNMMASNLLLGLGSNPIRDYYFADYSKGEKYPTLPEFVQAVVRRMTLPLVSQAVLDPTEAGQAANQKLIEAIPQIFVNRPPFVAVPLPTPSPKPTPTPSPSPTPTPTPTPSPEPSLPPGVKPSPSPF
jgi:hypothetical protein